MASNYRHQKPQSGREDSQRRYHSMSTRYSGEQKKWEDGLLLSYAEDEPEGQNPDGNEQNVHQLAVANPPARQSESDVDQGVRKEEDNQK